jgi:hypothetical protein
MVRPRWHDALIIVALVGVLVVGVCALWWDDVLGILGITSGSGSGDTPPPVVPGNV